MNDKAQWTFMIYLAGDNNLSAAGMKDIGEMRAVGSTDDVNIVVEFDRIGNAHETKRFHIQQGGANEPEWSLGVTDSGDPNVLLDFLEWVAENYKAERYALVLWNHGSGWAPDAMDAIAQEVKAVNWNVREGAQRSGSTLGRVLFRTTLQEIFKVPKAQERAICSDDGTGHSIDTVELGKVLVKAKDLFGQKLDLLGMDACLMSNLEVAYQARDCVKYVVASEENEPNDGWPYDKVLDYLVKNPDATTADFAAHIVDEYVKFYVKQEIDPVTQAALDLGQLSSLTGPLDVLSGALIPGMAQAKYWLGDALHWTEASFWHGTLWDIAEVCEYLAALTHPDDEAIKDQPEAIREAAKAIHQAAVNVRKALYPQSKTLVIAESHSGDKVERCGGVTLYLPPRMQTRISPYYKDVEYAKVHQWDEMLEKFHEKPKPPGGGATGSH
jgi:hypothetical protein